jgi:hypothetical protein
MVQGTKGRGSLWRGEGSLLLELWMREIYSFTLENIMECSKKFHEVPWYSITFHGIPCPYMTYLHNLPELFQNFP